MRRHHSAGGCHPASTQRRRVATMFYQAHRAEIDMAIAAEEALEPADG